MTLEWASGHFNWQSYFETSRKFSRIPTIEIEDAQMIWNYGLHWHVDRVEWGYPGVAGALWGIEEGTPDGFVDFREQRGIYALYSDYGLVYIGQTGSGNNRLFGRLNSHRTTGHLSGRWSRFSWFGIRWVTTAYELSADSRNVSPTPLTIRTALNILEALSIDISSPRLNRRRGNWRNDAVWTTQYFKWWQEYEDDDEE